MRLRISRQFDVTRFVIRHAIMKLKKKKGKKQFDISLCIYITINIENCDLDIVKTIQTIHLTLHKDKINESRENIARKQNEKI